MSELFLQIVYDSGLPSLPEEMLDKGALFLD
jgi:hypothetical protein